MKKTLTIVLSLCLFFGPGCAVLGYAAGDMGWMKALAYWLALHVCMFLAIVALCLAADVVEDEPCGP